VIFYTRWGTSYPEWWPAGTERDFMLGSMLAPLTPFKDDLILVSGITNASSYARTNGAGSMLGAAGASEVGDAMFTLLTARPAPAGGPATGPSLETVVGDCGGKAGPPVRLTVGKFGNDLPGVSFDTTGAAVRGERDPRVAATALLGHTVTAPAPGGDLSVDYPALGKAHMDVLVEALASSKTCAATLMWGDDVVTGWLPSPSTVHEASHETTSLYSAGGNPPQTFFGSRFVTLQHWYAEQFAYLLGRLQDTPLSGGTLLDRSIVVWISESGAGYDHTGFFVPVVIAGKGGGQLDTGRYIQVKERPLTGADSSTIFRTQGDLLAALARIWKVGSFGDSTITRQPFVEILKTP
jgi:hypothetical protein